jgi:seryl-tRNA synthetase
LTTSCRNGSIYKFYIFGIFADVLDVKFLRENIDRVTERLSLRGERVDLSRFLEIEETRRALLVKGESLKSERNKVNDEIARLKKEKGDTTPLISRMKGVSDEIKQIDTRISEITEELEAIVSVIPNIPHETVPAGTSDKDNVQVRTWGTIPTFDFPPQEHADIGEKLGILDFARGAKLAGARFCLSVGPGAHLERALINFMLDLHKDQGYVEVFPPAVINRKSCIGTGQLPKMHEDMYWIERDDLYLNPTAEVPVTNLYSDEILTRKDLPIYHTAYLPSFRREAGKHIETKGIARVHQFNKVELVKFVLPETSPAELETLTADAEAVVQGLKLPYRIRLLCTGSLGFHSAKTYDIEAFAPGMDQWLEVSSCSNFKDFQARRAMIKFRREPHLKSEFIHTLNGSGIALPRTMVSVLENYQNKDGTVTVPEVLRPYMRGTEVIN